MKTTTGERLKGIRNLIGLTQRDFSEILGVTTDAIVSMENNRQKVREDIFKAIGEQLPDFLHYLAYEGDIDFDKLKQNTDKICRYAVFKIEHDEIPEGFYLTKKEKKASSKRKSTKKNNRKK